MRGKKTCEVCRELSVRAWNVHNWLRYNLLARPGRDASGDLVWSPEDVAALRRLIAERASRRAAVHSA